MVRNELPKAGLKLPREVYGLLVDTLFRDSRSLVIGTATTILAVAVTAAKTQSWALAACCVAILVVISARLLLIRRYLADPAPVATEASAARWERGYSIGAGLHCLVLGIWCLLCLTTTTDGFAQLLSAVVTIGCAAAIPGRNFGRVGIASIQIGGLFLPLCLGWILQANWYYAFLTLVTLPFVAALRIMCQRLQATLLDALTANNKIGVLAERFDAALNNMPHGLCMLDRETRVQVCNPRLTEILGLPKTTDLQNLTFSDLLTKAGANVNIRTSGHESTTVEPMLHAREGGSIVIDIADGRSATLTLQPMSNGGTVIVAEDITLRRETEDKILRLARYDTVTDISNRAFFVEEMTGRVAAADLAGTHCALHFIDLDRFKSVNDTLGHAYGDLLLREVSDRLKGLLGSDDLLGRFGGDEFVVLQSSVADEKQASALSSAMIEALTQPFLLLGKKIKIGASIGVALTPIGRIDIDLLMQRADLALYRAKTAGRGRWFFFDAGMDQEVLRRRTLELDLTTAFQTDAVELFYQPLVTLETMRIGTCEALLRWRHPERGLISPTVFIPMAEEMGLITELGARVLHLACVACRTWPNETRVAVNLSAVQFQSDIVETIQDALWSAGLPANRLEVEITETVLLQNTSSIRTALQRIQDLGVTVVLDDFGTGHSSLSYLHNFPLQKIKLDRSFLEDVGKSERSLIILDGVGALIQRLGLAVVIEGIETDDQLAFVRGMKHIDEVQGFLLGRPVPRDEIISVLERSAFGSRQSDRLDLLKTIACAS